MPRYFFNVADGEREPDLKGLILADGNAARIAAIRFAGDVMSDEPDILKERNQFSVEVADESGAVLFVILTTIRETGSTGLSSD
jgi:hypothetical protein